MKPTELATRLGLTEDPAPLRFLAEAAYLWLDLGHVDKATKIFDSLVALCPADPTGFLGLGDARMKEGKAKQAVSALKKATRSPRVQVDTLAFAWRKLGDAQMLAGNRQLAEKAWEQAIETDPSGSDGALAQNRIQALREGPTLDDMDALLERLSDEFPGGPGVAG